MGWLVVENSSEEIKFKLNLNDKKPDDAVARCDNIKEVWNDQWEGSTVAQVRDDSVLNYGDIWIRIIMN